MIKYTLVFFSFDEIKVKFTKKMEGQAVPRNSEIIALTEGDNIVHYKVTDVIHSEDGIVVHIVDDKNERLLKEIIEARKTFES